MKSFPLRTALFASLALNLLAIGAVVGAGAAGLRLERAGAAEAEAAPRGAFMAALPPAERLKLRRALQAAFLETRDARRAARRERAAVMELATAQTYDAVAVREALRRTRAAEMALLARIDDAVVAALAELPAGQRRAAVEALVRERAAAARRALDRRWRGRTDSEERPAP